MLDLSNDEASSGKPVGKFDLRILEAKVMKSQKGENMVKMKLCVTGPKFNKYTVFETFMLEGAGAPMGRGRLADVMDKIGIPRQLENMSPFLNKVICGNLLDDKKSGYTKIDGYFKSEKADEPVDNDVAF